MAIMIEDMEEKKKKGSGRKSIFTKELGKKIEECYELGMKDTQVADIVGVTRQTIDNWKNANPVFFASIRLAKAKADKAVECAVLKAAKGHVFKTKKWVRVGEEYEQVEDETYYPPNPTCGVFWLKNRQGWKDRMDHEVSGQDGEPLTVVIKDYRKKEENSQDE